ncbi:MAG: aminotransferase class V-fold PLP-dependent enzyme [Rhodobacteraceae bacterium]|nr:aminotransferase class V-fold PLP-dependent enzyme [Paracoccaceae bacterium]
MTDPDFAWHRQHGLKPLINVAGTMTGLGASITTPSVAAATAAAMGNFVSIHEAQRLASTVIREATGAEAGFLTASASAGITLSVAACMTGHDPARVEALPHDPGFRDEVILQAGHLCGYGSSLEQTVRLTGARVRRVGQSTLCMDHHITGALSERTAAAVYVISHHVVHYGQCPLDRYIDLAHTSGIPVVVDAASEYDLRGFLALGADLVVYSGHKFLGGPTSGIIAGRRDLVRSAYLQNMGIGRGMKIGKESIFGAIAALQEWQGRDHAAIRRAEGAALAMWKDALADLRGIRARAVPDPTGNPLSRLQVEIDAKTFGVDAATVARILSEHNPAIIVRNHTVELGFFQLDPCNLQPGQDRIVAKALHSILSQPNTFESRPSDRDVGRNDSVNACMEW